MSSRPSTPVARRMSFADANAFLATVSASPETPRRLVTVVKIDARMSAGANAATTITNGKNETNALPARATLRSTNCDSSIRSHTRQTSVCSAHARSRATSIRICSTRWPMVSVRSDIVVDPATSTTATLVRAVRTGLQRRTRVTVIRPARVRAGIRREGSEALERVQSPGSDRLGERLIVPFVLVGVPLARSRRSTGRTGPSCPRYAASAIGSPERACARASV